MTTDVRLLGLGLGLLAVALTGCPESRLVTIADTLNRRQITSCLFYDGHASAYLSVRGVTATGGATLDQCQELR